MHESTLKAYRFYVWLNVVWYLCVAGFGIFTIVMSNSLAANPIEGQELPTDFLRGAGMLLIGISIVFGILAIGVLKQPVNEKTWMVHFVNICMGITTCCLAPFCIWMAIRWNSPEFRESLRAKQEREASFEL
jgi:hypothetical protein